MIWEFNEDSNKILKIELKHRALDEILGFIGGNLGLVMIICRLFLNPYAFNRFFIKNFTIKEEINMQVD